MPHRRKPPYFDTPRTPKQVRAPSGHERARLRALAGNPPDIYRDLDFYAPVPIPLGHSLFDIYRDDLARGGDHEWKRRAIAAWAMGVCELPAGKRDDVISGLRTVLRGKRKQTSRTRFRRFGTAAAWAFGASWLVLAVAVSLWSLATLAERGWKWDDISIFPVVWAMAAVPAALVAIPLAPFLIPFSMAKDEYSNHEARALAARSLLRLNAIEALPDLLHHAKDKSDYVCDECRNALCFLLPQLTEANRDVMPMNAERLLGEVLLGSDDLSLCSIILDHLEQWGQGASLRLLELFSETVVSLYLPAASEAESVERHGWERIASRTKQMIPLLEQRKAQASERGQLLRHSAAPATAPELLLRAATPHSEHQPETLLRPAHSLADAEILLAEERTP